MNVIRFNEHDTIGEMVLIGDQTAETAERTLNTSIKVDEEQSRRFGRVLTLIDMTKLGSFTPEALTVSIRSVGRINYDRVAVLNAPTAAKLGLTPAIELAGHSDIVRFFTERAEAVAWLQEFAGSE